MGSVSFSTYVRIAGCYEPYENIYAYLYCDKCGSFSLEPGIHPFTKKQIISKVITGLATPCMAGLAWILIQSWIPAIVICLIGLIHYKSIKESGFLRCKKCGNENITDVNVLHYPPNDESILDVPDEQVVKRYSVSIIPRM